MTDGVLHIRPFGIDERGAVELGEDFVRHNRKGSAIDEVSA